MTPVCSILIPSRGRPERLKKAIESIYATADPCSVDVLVALDSDDHESIDEASQMLCDVFVGTRGRGYADLNMRYDSLALKSRCPWVWIFNDDAEIVGEGWEEQLRQLPLTGLIVQPEHYQNGGSLYSRSEGTAFPIVPNGCWRLFGQRVIPDPADSQLDQLLRIQHGWKTHFLEGITVVHDRDNDEELSKHREL